MTRRVAALVLGLSLVLAGCSGAGEAEPSTPPTPGEAAGGGSTPAATGAEGSGADSGSAGGIRRSTVEVYFPSILGDGLIGEYSEIFATVTPGDQAKQIVSDLLSEPKNPEATRAVPPGTRLRQAYVLDNGDCYLDFSRQFLDGMRGGSMEEILTIYAIVDSVVLNVRRSAAWAS